MGSYLAVARYRKPHGLKGEVVVLPLTDRPETVFATGRSVMSLGEDGTPGGVSLEIERSRPFQRQWLLKFAGIDDRTAAESLSVSFLGVDESDVEAPGAGEIYEHEIPGCEVIAAGSVIGRANHLISLPTGSLLSVDLDGREVLVPFREPILCRVDRAARRIEIDPPDGLLEI